MKRPSRVREPWHPAEYSPSDIAAIKALYNGTATADQQKLALRWIIESAAQAHDQSFYPSNPNVTFFIEGRRSVGNQIIKLTKLKVGDNPKVNNVG